MAVRSDSDYKRMIVIYYLTDQMLKTCKYLVEYHLVSTDVHFKDAFEAVTARLHHIQGYASQDMQDNFDFGPNGRFLPHTIERAVETVLKKHGIIPENGIPKEADQ